MASRTRPLCHSLGRRQPQSSNDASRSTSSTARKRSPPAARTPGREPATTPPGFRDAQSRHESRQMRHTGRALAIPRAVSFSPSMPRTSIVAPVRSQRTATMRAARTRAPRSGSAPSPRRVNDETPGAKVLSPPRSTAAGLHAANDRGEGAAVEPRLPLFEGSSLPDLRRGRARGLGFDFGDPHLRRTVAAQDPGRPGNGSFVARVTPSAGVLTIAALVTCGQTIRVSEIGREYVHESAVFEDVVQGASAAHLGRSGRGLVARRARLLADRNRLLVERSAVPTRLGPVEAKARRRKHCPMNGPASGD